MYGDQGTATQQVREPLMMKVAQARKLAFAINENVKRIQSTIPWTASRTGGEGFARNRRLIEWRD
jgi:hypothetical protein